MYYRICRTAPKHRDRSSGILPIPAPEAWPGAVRAFTLTELMVTVAVAAILLAVAVPSFRVFIQNAQVNTTADGFLSAIQQARSEAITRGDAVLLCRTADPDSNDCGTSGANDWSGGWLMYVVRNFAGEVNFDNTNANHELIGRGSVSAEGVTITSDTQGNNWLTYAPDGTLAEDDAVAYAVCDDRGVNEGQLIVIPMIGRPYITDDMTGAPNCVPA